MMRTICTINCIVWCLLLAVGAGAEAEEPLDRLYAVDLDGSNLRRLPDVPGYEVLGAPATSPGDEWLGLDGWKRGESNSDAHILFLNLKRNEFRDLGPGAMPHWSADGKRLTYSSYQPRGVFVRSFDGAEVELIDELGWGIVWSPDGRYAVYMKNQNGGCQLVLYDFADKTRRGLFDGNALPFQYIYWNGDWAADSKSVAIIGIRHDDSREVSFVRLGDEGEPAQLEYLCSAKDFRVELAVHPTEPFLVVPANNQQLHRVNYFGSQDPTLVAGLPGDRINSGCCWTRDGKSLIFTSTGPDDR